MAPEGDGRADADVGLQLERVFATELLIGSMQNHHRAEQLVWIADRAAASCGRVGGFLLVATLVVVACGHGVLVTEDADGFRAIDPPSDFKGWIVEGTANFERDGKQHPIWTVADHEVHCDGHGFGYLRYDKPLKDFVVDVEFKTRPNVNSGVGIRGKKYIEGVLKSRPSMVGYEVQILDDAGAPPSTASSGSLYRYNAPLKNAVKKAGEWNRLAITSKGTKVVVMLNDQKVQDFEQTSLPATAQKPLDGYLSLQNHGGVVTFRNIRLKELKSSPETGR